jgi:sugar phosphate isomerase/epimerase
MAQAGRIKRGVSLYSYQEEFFLRKMSLEDCIGAVSALGADGIELLGEQMLGTDFPEPSEAFVEKWFGWMKKYGTRPTCFDAFLDTKLYKNRILTTEECVAMMERDLRIASRLGFRCLRTLVTTPREVIERSLPLAEKYGVAIGIEIHSPWSCRSEWVDEYLDLIARTGTSSFGFVPDMGIFVKRFPPCILEWYTRRGARRDLVDYVAKAYEDRADTATTKAAIERRGGGEIEKRLVDDASRYRCDDPTWLNAIMPHIIHIHAKFYEMTDDCEDPSILYPEVVPVLDAGGYDGYLSSEYEGNRHIQDAYPVDSVEQVRRQHVMLKRLLGESR